MRAPFIGFLALVPAAGLHAATLVVDQGGGGDFTAIQPAIDAAAEGDTVLVKPGEYVITAPITFLGKAITVTGEAGADQTTIRMSPTPADSARTHVVIFENGETAEAMLQGFTVSGSGSTTGTGIYCAGASPTIVDCTISHNAGGGVSCTDASPTLTNLRITDNSAVSGGGVFCFGGSPLIADCTIARNSALTGGAGIMVVECSPTIRDSTISDNVVVGTTKRDVVCPGGGIYCASDHDASAHLTLTGCTIRENSAVTSGGGIYLATGASITDCVIAGNSAYGTSSRFDFPPGAGGGVFCAHHGLDVKIVEITGCTIAGNLAACAGGGIHGGGALALHVSSSVIWDNAGGSMHMEEGVAASIEFNCIEGDDIPSGEGNINDDPHFLAWGDEAEVTVRTQAELEAALGGYSFTLAVSSPCIGTGTDGADMGADGDRCPEPGFAARRILLGPGSFDINGFGLRHKVSITGAGSGETTVEGTVYGLRTNQSLSGVTVTRGRAGGIVISGGEAPEIAGCAITRNTPFDESVPYHAGGITCNERSRPTIRDCLISMNAGVAGGIRCQEDSSPLIRNCTISQNEGYGIICGEGSDADICDCRVTRNRSGGVWLYLSPSRITNCLLSANRGSGIKCSRSPAEITNCVITANSVYGIGCDDFGLDQTLWTMAVTNCTIVGQEWWDLYGSRTADPLLRNCIIGTRELLQASFTFCCTMESPFPGEGNLNADPLFVSAGEYDFTRNEEIEINGTVYELPDIIVTPGDFHLQSNSPCIDAGTGEGAPGSDIEGHTRPCGGGTDMGAYEFPGPVPVDTFRRGDGNSDGRIDIADAIFTLGHLFSAGPEPSCLDAADANDDGRLDIADAIAVLGHLFADAGPLPDPFEGCGTDATTDDLDCRSYEACE